jgi:murein DD-endopeptidase MepM/ murein hydrolase activator NlpD
VGRLGRRGRTASAARPHSFGRIAVAAFCVAWLGVGCASRPDDGVVHVLRSGETIYRLSRYYDVKVGRIIDANDIDDVTEVPVGARLYIPGARRASSSRSASLATPVPNPTRPRAPTGDLRKRARREADLDFAWPVSGNVSSRFGWRDGRHHEGIDIPANKGTPIRAAEAGRVVHSGGGLGAYGTVVILKHAGRYQTIYAHNRRNKVRAGDFVEKGDVIAEVGTSGNASGPHVHFEVRRDRRPLDPLSYLP